MAVLKAGSHSEFEMDVIQTTVLVVPHLVLRTDGPKRLLFHCRADLLNRTLSRRFGKIFSRGAITAEDHPPTARPCKQLLVYSIQVSELH